MEDPIRRAGPADIPSLHVLIESAYRGDSARRGWTHEADLLGGQRTDPAALADLIADPAQAILVLPGPDGFSGCVCVTDKGEGVAMLGMLSVDPSIQAQGLGRRLIAAAEAHARHAFGARRMEMTVIHTRRELIDWYARRGYRDTGRHAPFPMSDPRFGLPKVDDLEFVVLAKDLA